ncbi:hypothetical protein F5Y15DRAFT_419568 [Xylariaceae sp. FL0016]|nr:hypothetical protein F5Y15DRAFT_419568 [Xylariaceae sp. FL0016]
MSPEFLDQSFPAADVSQDVDTCRICRTEATADEPLFYPCKCSGSIKFVHQDCLMEWLSHSQKKHCELCKTPFRFTKLYSPDMPRHLPFHVFATHMARYMLRNLLVWMRAALVFSVWLGWLPYLMRSVWSFLFWVSDDGFGPPRSLHHTANATALRGQNAISLSVTGTGTNTCPSSPLLAATTTSATIGAAVDKIPVSNLLRAVSKPLVMGASSSSWWRILFGIPVTRDETMLDSANATSLSQPSLAAMSPSLNPNRSLLSGVSLLNNVTRNPTINRTIIAVLEGQVITLLVIVCFILIILVRDYVVQQQPEINMRAAFAAAENDDAQPPADNWLDNGIRAIRDLDSEDDDDSDTSDAESTTAVQGDQREGLPVQDEQDATAIQNLRPRPIAGLRRRQALGEDGVIQDIDHRPVVDIAEPSNRSGAPASATRAQRPGPTQQDFRGFLSASAGNGDQVKSNGDDEGDDTSQATVKEYLRIYREAGGDHEKILEMIRNEGLEYRLRYWVKVTQAMADSTRSTEADTAGTSSTEAVAEGSSSRAGHTSSLPFTASGALQNGAPENDSSKWTWADKENGSDANSTSRAKGKAPVNQAADPLFPQGSGLHTQQTALKSSPMEDAAHSAQLTDDEPPRLPTFLRPRAVSDGPQHHDTINPLANNSWSFAELSSNTQDADDASDKPSTAHMETPLHAPYSDVIQDGATSSSGIDTETPPGTPHSGLQAVGDGVGNAGPSTHEAEIGAQAEVPIESQSTGPAPDTVAQHPGSIVERMADFMWGDVNDVPADDLGPEEAVDIFGDNQNAPFMDDMRDGEGNDEDEVEMAPDVVEAAVAAGLDPEAIEDAEDFEGIMELIGMRGPVAGLFQNAVFCAFLVSISIFMGIFIPYNIGRVSVWISANPTRIIRMWFSFAKFVQDGALLAVGYVSSHVFQLLEWLSVSLGVESGKRVLEKLGANAAQVAASSFDRIANSLKSEIPIISASEMRNFSAISHESLILVKGDIYDAVSTIGSIVVYILGGNYMEKWATARDYVVATAPVAIASIKALRGTVVRPGTWMVGLSLPARSISTNPELAYWDADDRTLAIILGYVSITLLAALYLGRGTPFSSSRTAQEWEASIIDALNQASGVMKVILIISIEMLIFPLYCGLLLDFALLPLFEGTSLKSRLLFTYNYPLTSIFVHWFVGTGYMFHFALFVSMCRKIMRKGVLYFIRDPDDPEFHPVRDVLERNVTTQLRKILFSAFVYGALVVICLGGVVWGLSLTLPNVLPIHYSSNEPVLEFPIDLLFYNFLMPLAVKFFKPSDALHAMYTWWFRKCARGLRLTWFLFGERRVDEEGRLALSGDSRFQNSPWWRKAMLEVNSQNEVIPKTWYDTFEGGKAKPISKIPSEEMMAFHDSKSRLVESGQLIPDGRFVRSPASDQVKIPKGQAVFLDVTEQDMRRDGRADQPDTDLYSGTHYQFVYVPPWFRTRVFLFILFIWIFAAVTGVGFTIVPLVFGRRMFKVLIPSHIRTNDIYAFSIGIYILGSLGYFIFHVRSIMSQVQARCTAALDSMDRHAIQRTLEIALRACHLLYTYIMLLVVFPLLITVLVEFYVLLPLHTYMYPAGLGSTSRLDGLRGGHTIRVIQAWTLGILYLKLGSRALTLYGGRPAHAVRAVLRRGWLEPDVGVLTRAFVIPGVTASIIMLFTPPLVAWAVLESRNDAVVTHEMRVFAYRLAYPLTALFWAALLFARRMFRIFEGWKQRIRDEAYLMGERLHNFSGASTKATSTSVWKGGTRL